MHAKSSVQKRSAFVVTLFAETCVCSADVVASFVDTTSKHGLGATWRSSFIDMHMNMQTNKEGMMISKEACTSYNNAFQAGQKAAQPNVPSARAPE
eukprot:766430-Hanusia_phi.AAC.1